MGIVHAKGENHKGNTPESLINGLEKKQINYNDCDDTKEINLEGVKATVDKIHVDGLARTKNDIVEDAVKDLFQANDFQEVLIKIHSVKSRLETLGCFRNIAVFIDTSKGPKSSPDGLEVTFQVKELSRIVGGVSTHVGNNEGSLVVGMKTPNLFGRGERFQVEYSHGSQRTNNFNIAFIKPLRGKHNRIITTSIYKQLTEWPPSGYKEDDIGVCVDLGFNSLPLIKHNIQWVGAMRQISVLGRGSAFEVREASGPTLKSALRHILSVDFRDDLIFPSCGSLFQLTTEFAGLGGNVGFFKNDAFLQSNYSIAEDYVIQTTFNAGYIKSIDNDMKITLSDLFFLGGPLNIRGFHTRGIGPRMEGDALGAKFFWCGGLHLFTPLPFRPGKGGFGDLFRTHFFVTWGSIGNLNDEDKPTHEQILDNIRLSYGIGIAMKLGQIGRIELNYCVPHLADEKDLTQTGVQFGIGVRFL